MRQGKSFTNLFKLYNFLHEKDLLMFAKFPLTALRSFEAAARLGSFKAAAEELSVTASAVSFQIKSLEGWVGTLMFDRSSQGVSLTSAGKMLYTNIHQSFADIDQSLNSLRPTSNPCNLTLSTTPAFAALWLIPRLGSFYREFPDIQVSVVTNREAVDLNRNSTIDIEIRCVPREPSDVYHIELMSETFSAYTAPTKISPPVNSAIELINVRLTRVTAMPRDWNLWCVTAEHEDWLNGAIFRDYDDEHHAIQAAISGYGMVLASDILVFDSVSQGLLIPYKSYIKIPGAQYTAACVPGRQRIPALGFFFNWLTNEFSSQHNQFLNYQQPCNTD